MLLHAHCRHSILFSALALATLGGAAVAQAETSHFFGRWTVSDDKPAFSAKGLPYKTVDIAACGADFCGVSVDDKGTCGATLFRFLTIHANNEDLTGHGLWGDLKKKLQLIYLTPDGQKTGLMIGLGADDFDFTGREGSMPIFQANYQSAGEAKCTVGGHTS